MHHGRPRLKCLGDDMWAKTTLFVLNRRVVFYNPDTASREDVLTGQGVLQIPLIVVSGDMENAVRALWQRDESTVGKIERQRNIAQNQAVIAGTRIPVRSVKAFAAAGYSIEQIKREYPTLTEQDIRDFTCSRGLNAFSSPMVETVSPLYSCAG
jgi:uncharacterized protein (DUF433 family)